MLSGKKNANTKQIKVLFNDSGIVHDQCPTLPPNHKDRTNGRKRRQNEEEETKKNEESSLVLLVSNPPLIECGLH
jgi:hypothetical protein